VPVLGFELRSDLARLVIRAVNVDIEIAAGEARKLFVRELRAVGHAPCTVRALCQGDDWGPGLSGRADVTVSRDAVDPNSLDLSLDRVVPGDRDLPLPCCRGRHGWGFLSTGQTDFHILGERRSREQGKYGRGNQGAWDMSRLQRKSQRSSPGVERMDDLPGSPV
jgi:hypothetical protein